MVGTKQRYATGPSMAPWIVAGVVLVVAVAVIAWMLGRDSSSAEPAPVETSSETPPPAPEAADGCLGGTDPTTAILAAQEEAPLTAEGAAAFAATYLRWRLQTPRPTNDLQTVGAQVWTDDFPEDGRREGEPIPGSSVRSSFVDQRYTVHNASSDSAVVATTWLGVDDAGVYQTVQTVIFTPLQAVDGVWRVGSDEAVTPVWQELGIDPADPSSVEAYKSELLETGTEYREAC